MDSEIRGVHREHGSRFVSNVLWGFLGVGVNIVIGLLLSPMIVRQLGVEQYGVWVLLFSTADYLRMLDFGFRSAVVNRCARARTREDIEGINRTVATALVYFVAVATACLLLAVTFRGPVLDAFDVAAELRSAAAWLVVIIAATVSLRLMFAPLTAVLEAYERFDLIHRAYIAALIIRATGTLALLLSGHGLVELAWVVLAAQALESGWNLVSVRRVVPGLRMTRSDIGFDNLQSLFQYGRYSALMVTADLVSMSAPMTIIGALRGPAEVAFFAVPFRLLFYTAEVMSKVAGVTASTTAALDELGDRTRVRRLAIDTNGHCFVFFMPVALFLLLYGTPLLQVWISPEVARQSGAMIPVFLLMFVFAVAGQYNSGAILIGQGRHSYYALAIVIEVLLTVCGLMLVVPRYGAVGAAWVVSVVFLVVRGMGLAYVVCRVNGFPFGNYLQAIYGRGLVAAVPVLLLASMLRAHVWSGFNWSELIRAAAAISVTYYAAALIVLAPAERATILARARSPFRGMV